MPIDFHSTLNAHTYTGRQADPSWTEAITQLVDPHGLDVVDVGCGGGTYSQQWARIGAASVVAVDWSEAILQSAQEAVGGDERIQFRMGTARRPAARRLAPMSSSLGLSCTTSTTCRASWRRQDGSSGRTAC